MTEVEPQDAGRFAGGHAGLEGAQVPQAAAGLGQGLPHTAVRPGQGGGGGLVEGCGGDHDLDHVVVALVFDPDAVHSHGDDLVRGLALADRREGRGADGISHRLIDERGQDGGLAACAGVDGGDGDGGFPRDVGHGDPTVAAGQEQAHGRGQDRRAGLGGRPGAAGGLVRPAGLP